MRSRLTPDHTRLIDEKHRANLARREAELHARLGGRVYRPMFGVRISYDHGKNWYLLALCDECRASVEPPTMRKDLGGSGARNCDWCGARNEER